MPKINDLDSLEKEFGNNASLYIREELNKSSKIKISPEKIKSYIVISLLILSIGLFPSITYKDIMYAKKIQYSSYGYYLYGNVLVYDSSKKIFAIDEDFGKVFSLGDDGKILWYFDLGDDYDVESAVCSDNGTLYVGSHDGYITVINSEGFYEKTINLSDIISDQNYSWHFYKLMKCNDEIFVYVAHYLYEIYPKQRIFNLSFGGEYLYDYRSNGDILSLIFHNYSSENIFRVVNFNVTSWRIESNMLLRKDISKMEISGIWLYTIDYLSVKAYENGVLIWEKSFNETPMKVKVCNDKLYIVGKFQDKLYLYELSMSGEVLKKKLIFENEIVKKSDYIIKPQIFFNEIHKILYISLMFYGKHAEDKYFIISFNENLKILKVYEINSNVRLWDIQYSKSFNDFYSSRYFVYFLAKDRIYKIDFLSYLPFKIGGVAVTLVVYRWWKWKRKC